MYISRYILQRSLVSFFDTISLTSVGSTITHVDLSPELLTAKKRRSASRALSRSIVSARSQMFILKRSGKYTLAVAVGRMLKLRYFAAGADVAHCKRTEYAGPSFECEFTAVHDREKARLHWTVPQGWSMGEPLKELWEKIIGVDGTVDYEEW